MNDRKKPVKYFPYVPNQNVQLTNWLPPINKKFINLITNSWFDIKEFNNAKPKIINFKEVTTPIIPPDSLKQQLRSIKKLNNRKSKNNIIKEPRFMCTKKIRIYPTQFQKDILNSWFIAFAQVFNCTINKIRKNIFKNGKLIDIKEARKFVNFFNLRKTLSNKRNEIQNLTNPHKIPIHILDEAIHQAVSNFKTCITNYSKGYIKKFRIRDWSYNRCRMIIKIEKGYFRNGTFCPTIFSSIKSSSPLINIENTVTLQYNKDTKKYIMLVPIGIQKKKILMNPMLDAGIDLGVRSFATVYSQNNTLSICNRKYEGNYDKDFKKYHMKIDKINELLQSTDDVSTSKQKLKHALRKYHLRIKNKVKDMHFKVAHQLVNRFDNIYIGKLSTKKILSRNNKTISKLTKRMIGVLSPYMFRQILIYMGYKYGTNVEEVDEYLTTKTCSQCGKLNEIGKSKVHICKCGMKADRDENSAKNHLKIGLAKRMEVPLKKVLEKDKRNPKMKSIGRRINNKIIVEV